MQATQQGAATTGGGGGGRRRRRTDDRPDSGVLPGDGDASVIVCSNMKRRNERQRRRKSWTKRGYADVPRTTLHLRRVPFLVRSTIRSEDTIKNPSGKEGGFLDAAPH